MKRLFDDSEISLYSLELYFATSSIFYSQGLGNATATFDLMVRDKPPHRNFLMAGGLEAIIQFLNNLKFTDDQIEHLLNKKTVSKEFADYLRDLSFSGSVYAMPEGTVHFPGEPMLRITAPLIEANIITDALIGLATVDTLYLSKLARIRIAADNANIAVGGIRAPGIDAGWRLCRNALFFENMGFSNTAVAKRMGIDSAAIIVGNHAFIKAFPNELEAMRALTKDIIPSAPMIDTYDYKQGIKNAITIANELKAQGKKLFAITIDSGNVLRIANYARRELDRTGHKETLITVTGNLDEYKIADLVKNKIPANGYLVVTEVVTSSDSPKLETVYKLAQLEQNGKVQHTAKFAPGKLSFPGVKQVYRKIEDGKLVADYIGLEGEDLGQPLLVPIFENGKQAYKVPSYEEIREYVKGQLRLLPNKYLELEKDYNPPVDFSDKIKNLLKKVRMEHDLTE